jgi:hypothetical protein
MDPTNSTMTSINYDLLFPLEATPVSIRSQYVVLLTTMHVNKYDQECVINGLAACLRWVETSQDDWNVQHAHLRCLLELLGVEAVNIALQHAKPLTTYNRLCRAINNKFGDPTKGSFSFYEQNRALIERVTAMYTPTD